MDYILYFMLEPWNNTQTLQNQSISHTYTHNWSLACHTHSLKYIFYMLHEPLLWPDSFIIFKLLPTQSNFLYIQNIRKIMLICLPLPLLYYLALIIWNLQTTRYFHIEIFIGWWKLLVYLMEVFTFDLWF